MSSRLRFAAPALSLATLLLAPSPSFAQTCDAGWQCKVNYGATTAMDLYVPAQVAASPAVVVALHYCGGTSANAHSWFKVFADTYHFAIITPQAGGNCFDAAPARSGERANIVSMVQYVMSHNNADTKRIFAAGASSGACMTQALLAAYPDVFAAGSSLAAVPAGAWTGGNTYAWSTPSTTTAQQWGDKVRQADPGFSGTRPRIQLWQGQGDTTLTYSQNYPAEVAQWTNVFGVTSANATMTSIKPAGLLGQQAAQDTWARTSYKDGSGTVVVEANSGPSNVPHDLTGRGLWSDVVRFFGLDQTSSGGAGGAGGTGGAGAGGAGAGGAGAGGAGAGGAGAGGAGAGGAGAGGAGAGGAGAAGVGTGGTAGIGTGDSGGIAGGAAGASAGAAGSGVAGSGTGGSYAGASSGGSTSTSGAAGVSGSAGSIATSGTAGDTTQEPGLSAPAAPGCSCRVGGESHSDSWLGLLAAGALFSAVRRSRRR